MLDICFYLFLYYCFNRIDELVQQSQIFGDDFRRACHFLAESQLLTVCGDQILRKLHLKHIGFGVFIHLHGDHRDVSYAHLYHAVFQIREVVQFDVDRLSDLDLARALLWKQYLAYHLRVTIGNYGYQHLPCAHVLVFLPVLGERDFPIARGNQQVGLFPLPDLG